jgi:hypothetical protein
MSTDSDPRVRNILDRLGSVNAIRSRQSADPTLSMRVQALKAYQQQQFRDRYRDLLTNVRYQKATHFFLEDLYGPGDFSSRDTQFARVVPALVRLFPEAVVDAVLLLGELHALSEELDDVMARTQLQPVITEADYVLAWRLLDQSDSRQHQLNLALELGSRLDRLTRSRLLGQSLRWMRPAARAAGLEQLQQFLERGLEGFLAMRGSEEFLATIQYRELQFISAMQRACSTGGIEHP